MSTPKQEHADQPSLLAKALGVTADLHVLLQNYWLARKRPKKGKAAQLRTEALYVKLGTLSTAELRKKLKKLTAEYEKVNAEVSAEALKQIAEIKHEVDSALARIRELLDNHAGFNLAKAKEAYALCESITPKLEDIQDWEEVLDGAPPTYDYFHITEVVEDRYPALIRSLCVDSKEREESLEAFILDLTARHSKRNPPLNEVLSAAFAATKQKRSIVYHGYFEAPVEMFALEIKQGSSVYLVPTLALSMRPWSDCVDFADASDLTEADLEVIATLYGGGAYLTLKAARAAALELR